MAFLTVNGYDIPVMRDSVKETYYGQNISRAYDGTPVSVERCFKRAWKMTVKYSTQAEAEALKGLLLGRGHNWGFDTSLYSGKGLASTLTRATTATNSNGQTVLSGAARYENGPYFTNFSTDKAVTIEEGTTNIASSAQSRCVSGWTTANDSGNVTWTQNAGGEEKITGVVTVNTGTIAYVQLAFNASAYQGLPITFSVTVEITGHTSGVIDLAMFDKQSGAYDVGVNTIISTGNVSGRYSVVKTLRNPIDNDSSSLLCRVRLAAGTNAGTNITIRRVQVEQKAYSTSWQIGGTARNAEILTIPASIFNPHAWTVAMWFKPTSTQVIATKTGRLLSINIDSTNIWRMMIHVTGRPYFDIVRNGVAANTYNASDTVLATDTWYFLAAYSNGQTVTMTINGVNTASAAVAYNIPVGSLSGINMYVGSDGSGGNQPNGYYSCLSILPYTMTTAGLLAYYNLSRPCYNLPRFEVTGTLVNRPTSNPMICKAEVSESTWHQFASQYQTLDVTLYEV